MAPGRARLHILKLSHRVWAGARRGASQSHASQLQTRRKHARRHARRLSREHARKHARNHA
eukprot:4098723-Alexandrium_andersonii.AAC.1